MSVLLLLGVPYLNAYPEGEAGVGLQDAEAGRVDDGDGARVPLVGGHPREMR